MILLGLTGSIGMGKSTAAGMFRGIGVPVFDADAEVHRLYSRGGAAVDRIGMYWPDAVRAGAVDRTRLSRHVVGDSAAMGKLESLVHPLTTRSRERFIERVREQGHGLAVLDIPLLFETGSDQQVDKIAVVSAPLDLQQRRVLARPGMTPEKFAAITARQLPDMEKRARAHYVIDTGLGRACARSHIDRIAAELRALEVLT